MEKFKTKSYAMDMSSGPLLQKMLAFALPLMLSGIVQLLFNAADIVVVGRYAGDNALAAVGSNGSLINLIVNVFIGMSVGTNVLAAREYGAKNSKELSKTVHTSMLLAFIGGVFLTLLGLVMARRLLTWMGTPEAVIDLSALYLRIYFLGMTASMIYNFGSAVLRSIGDTRRPMYFLLLAGVINVLLNLFFVIVLKMSVAGVALATIISQCVSAGLVLMCLMREEGWIRLELKELKIHKDKLIQIVKTGLPAGFQGMLFSLSNVVIQSSVNSFGEIVMAGNSAAGNIEGFVYVSMNCFYQATISFTGQNMGAGNIRRIYKILLTGQLCVVVSGLLFGNAAYLLGGDLLSIYSSSPDVIAAGLTRLSVVSATYAICGMMDVMVGALRGLGYSVMPMIVSLLGACAFRLAWIATIFQQERFHTIKMLYLSYPVSWALTFAAHLICFFIVMKKVRQRFPQQPAETE
ncbi:MAG: MATE family efflux transporter [Clostridia bacterium]|nr:MATE family efflux transporter [Clostridia bacterium]